MRSSAEYTSRYIRNRSASSSASPKPRSNARIAVSSRGPVAEDEESGAERAQLGQRHAVDDGGHRMLADAEVKILPAVAAGLEAARPRELQSRLVRRAKISGTAEEPRDVVGEHVQHLPGGVSPRHAFGIGGEDGEILVPARGKLAPLHQLDLRGELRILRLVGGG